MSDLAAVRKPDSRPDFDGMAGIYRWLEYLSFGPFLWRCRSWFLPQLRDCRRALVLGDGDGRFTARLLRKYPRIEVTAIDLSGKMIAALRQAAGENTSRLRTEVADLRSWSPARYPGTSYDLVVTHFFLDCLTSEEVSALAGRVAAVAGPDALWVVSEFAVPPGWFGQILARPLVAGLYLAFQWLTGLEVRQLPDFKSALQEAGWDLEAQQPHLRGLLLSQLWRRKPHRI